MSKRRYNGPSRRSKNWSSSVVGTHASSNSARSSHRSVSSTRRRTQNYSTRSAELRQMNVGGSKYTARVSHRDAERFVKKGSTVRRVRNVILVIVILAAVVGIAFALGSCAYRSSVSGSMALNDDDVKGALTTPSSNSAYNVLIVGIGEDAEIGQTAGLIMIARIDEQNKKVTLLNVPNNIAATLSKNGDYMLRDAISVGGEKELVSAVSKTLDIDIAHYVRTTKSDFINLVNTLGGVDVNVEQRVDDPRVSSIVLSVGEQTLNGDEALTLASAYNYKDGRIVRSGIQKQILTNLIAKVKDKSGMDFLTCADAISKTFKTDLTFDDLERITEVYNSCENVYYTLIPGSQSVVNEKTYYVISSTSWAKAKEKFLAGEDPQTSIDTSQVDKTQITIDILNGSGTDGLATLAESKLVKAGYQIKSTGNAESYVYNETLVVYKENKDSLAAEAIVQDLGVGRTVAAGSFYSLENDIQIYIGKDWKAVD